MGSATCADTAGMLGDVPLWATVLQFLAAGLVGGFCVLQWVWWRGALRSEGSTWSLALSVTMGALLLVGGLHGVTESPPVRAVLEFGHAQLLGVLALVALPATRAFGGRGPRVRPWAVAVGVVLALRAALWFWPAEQVPGVPGGRAAAVALLFVMLAVVVGYVVAALGRARLTRPG